MLFKNQKRVKELEDQVSSLKKDRIEMLGDFIFILEKIQEENDSNAQWKHKTTVIGNQLSLSIERMNAIKKDLENDINGAIV